MTASRSRCRHAVTLECGPILLLALRCVGTGSKLGLCFVGTRSKLYTLVYSVALAGSSIGPLTAAAAFAVTGNKWQLHTLQHVILIGLALALLPVVALLFFDDDKALPSEEHAAYNASEDSSGGHTANGVLANHEHEPLNSPTAEMLEDGAASAAQMQQAGAVNQGQHEPSDCEAGSVLQGRPSLSQLQEQPTAIQLQQPPGKTVL